MTNLSPAEYGRHLASLVTPTDARCLEAARILLSNDERMAA